MNGQDTDWGEWDGAWAKEISYWLNARTHPVPYEDVLSQVQDTREYILSQAPDEVEGVDLMEATDIGAKTLCQRWSLHETSAAYKAVWDFVECLVEWVLLDEHRKVQQRSKT